MEFFRRLTSVRTISSHLGRAGLAFAAIALIEFAVVLWDLTMGGFHAEFFGLRISSWEAYKPFRVGMVAITIGLWLHDRTTVAETSWEQLSRYAPWIAGATAIASTAIAVHWGIVAAGGADAYGYVSQAALWAHGHVSARDPLAAIAMIAGPAAAPLGYQMAAAPGSIVPTYPAGLPLLMAIAIRIGGPSAAFLVVPLCAGIAVWLTYVLATRLAGARAGVIAAVLVAFSPIFLFQSFEPMSDVPATMWWLLAWLLTLSSSGAAAFGAGFAVSAALLTRPNLAPLAIVVVVAAALVEPRGRRAWLAAAGIVPGCAAVAALNTCWYGGPLRSGYGPLEALYAWDHVVPNLRHQWTWMIELNAWVVLPAVAAPWLVRARRPAIAAMLTFFAALIACYAGYVVYDDWPFFRFLLPGLPLLIALAAAVIVRALSHAPLPARGAAAFVLCTLIPIASVLTADRHTVFEIGRAEQRYAAVGESIAMTLPDNAVVLTVIQSGSVRMYGRRPTLRWDKLDPARLDQTVDGLRAAGYAPYVLLESWEDRLFSARFAATQAMNALTRRPAIEYYGPVSVRVVPLATADVYCGERHDLTRAVPAR